MFHFPLTFLRIVNFCMLLSSFKFRTKTTRKQSKCLSLWIKVRLDVLSGLIWVQTIFNGYQQKTLTGKEIQRKGYYHIRIHYECEGRIEKYVPRIAVWHHEACRVMTNGDSEGRIFLSYPHTNNEFLFLAHHCFFFFFLKNKLPEVYEYAKMQLHMMMSL